jgi:ketosteroid isomerase-like protein
MILALVLALAAAAAQPAADRALAAELRARDQALLEAIAPGDRKLWDKALAPDALYVDENGEIMDRAAYLKALTPLPKGASGHITIVDYRLTRSGDTALVIHRDDEREDFHGVKLHADYLMTETWLRRAGEWRLAMVHVYVVAVDPPAIAIAPAVLDGYVGRYRAGNDLAYIVRRDGDHLVGGREGSPAKPLRVEAADVLFTPGQPRIRRLFQRDRAGRVTGFIDRREGEDLVWTRAPAR